MGALAIMILAFVGYIIMYQLYGKFVGNKIFGLSAQAKVPSVEFEDGTDYVPTRKEIIFATITPRLPARGRSSDRPWPSFGAGCRR